MSTVLSTNHPPVEYRECPGHPGYRVGSDGSVWSCWRRKGLGRWKGSRFVLGDDWHQMRPAPTKWGRRLVGLCPERTYHFVHRLVLEAFVGPCPDEMECCHNDGNPLNNALDNLRWDTKRANQADRVKHGTHSRGERNANAKLTEADVRAIRAEHASGGASQAELSRKYGVDPALIGRIIQRRSWAHVV